MASPSLHVLYSSLRGFNPKLSCYQTAVKFRSQFCIAGWDLLRIWQKIHINSNISLQSRNDVYWSKAITFTSSNDIAGLCNCINIISLSAIKKSLKTPDRPNFEKSRSILRNKTVPTFGQKIKILFYEINQKTCGFKIWDQHQTFSAPNHRFFQKFFWMDGVLQLISSAALHDKISIDSEFNSFGQDHDSRKLDHRNPAIF